MSPLVFVLLACPAPFEVERALDASVKPSVKARHRWDVAVEGPTLRVTLRDDGGALVRQRVVPAPEACRERARVAGAVLAAWMMESPGALDGGAVESPGESPRAESPERASAPSASARTGPGATEPLAEAAPMGASANAGGPPPAAPTRSTEGESAASPALAPPVPPSTGVAPSAAPGNRSTARGGTSSTTSVSTAAAPSTSPPDRANERAGPTSTNAGLSSPSPGAAPFTPPPDRANERAGPTSTNAGPSSPSPGAAPLTPPPNRADEREGASSTASALTTASASPLGSTPAPNSAARDGGVRFSAPAPTTPEADATLPSTSRPAERLDAPTRTGPSRPDGTATTAANTEAGNDDRTRLASALTLDGAAPAPPPALSTTLNPADPTDASFTPWRLDLGLHTRGEWSTTVSPALGVRLGLGRRFGGFLELDAALPRDATLGVGTITWNRFSAGLGVRYQAPLGRVLLEPGVSVDVAALWVRSRGYTVDAEAVRPDVAACGHLRAGYRFGGLLVFGGARVCGWPITTRAQVPSVDGIVVLPLVDASLVIGLGWEWLTGSAPSGLSDTSQVAHGR